MIHDDVLGTVGRTPLVRLRNVVPSGHAEVLAKLEFFAPGGSIKDRAAVAMLDAAERAGSIRRGDTIVEASGGNTGVGLAMACAVRGYRCVIVVPETTSTDKLSVLRTFGAEIVAARVDVEPSHAEGYIGRAERIAGERKAFMPDQFVNPANPAIHEQTTALEILEDCEGRLDAFVACVGSGGTVAGIGRVLRDRVPSVRIVAAAPERGLGERGQSVVEGIVDEVDAENTHGTPPDLVLRVTDRDAITMTLRLAREEGILAGASSGVALCAALRLARELGPGKRVVTMVPDTGRNYLSTYFNEAWRKARGFET
ncbi:MAG TPA: cysteine synthase family protein [Polyangiaceae bacterium]